MPHRIAIATEGPSDKAILETICGRAGFQATASWAGGKGALFKSFDKMLKVLEVTFRPTHFLVVADLHPDLDCSVEAKHWRKEVKRRFPAARMCLCVWEVEAWLLADPRPVADMLDKDGFTHSNPDKVGDPPPSEVLEQLFHERLGYHGGATYHKEADGKTLAERMNLEAAASSSPSLAHFMREIRTRQEHLNP